MLILAFILALAVGLQEFEIKLDGSPYEMYRAPALALKEKSLIFIHELLDSIDPRTISTIKQAYTNTKHLYPSKVQEMRGVADALALSEEDVFVFQYIYEIYTYCTTIIARNSLGKVMVGRNLDYMFNEDLSSTHYMAIYTLKGKESFRCTNYGGFIGVSTCMKPHQFIVALNSRYSLYDTVFEDNLVHLSQGGHLVAWAIRDAMNKSASFKEAKIYLTNAHIVAPAYYIVAGIQDNQGCVINRERNLTKSTLCLSDDRWYIVQVNTDYDLPMPRYSIDRRTPAQAKLNSIGQSNICETTLVNSILSEYPNRFFLTIFSAFIDANTATLNPKFYT